MGSGTTVFCCDVTRTVSSIVEVARAPVGVTSKEEVNMCNWCIVDIAIETVVELDSLVDNRVAIGELVKNGVDMIDDFDVESRGMEKYDSVAVIKGLMVPVGVG